MSTNKEYRFQYLRDLTRAEERACENCGNLRKEQMVMAIDQADPKRPRMVICQRCLDILMGDKVRP